MQYNMCIYIYIIYNVLYIYMCVCVIHIHPHMSESLYIDGWKEAVIVVLVFNH